MYITIISTVRPLVFVSFVSLIEREQQVYFYEASFNRDIWKTIRVAEFSMGNV